MAHTEETKRKISETRLSRKIGVGIKLSEEHRRKISESLKGRQTSGEHRENLSIALMGNKNCSGRKISAEHKKKINQSGRKRSEESKEKMRLAKLNNPVRYWKGKPRPEETKIKISQNLFGRYRGEKNPSWRGGSNKYYGGEFTETLKEEVRVRDNNICQLCGEKENGIKHDCHHIDYNKLNNELNNIILLCKSCHAKTNWNREYWLNHFMEEENEKRYNNIIL